MKNNFVVSCTYGRREHNFALIWFLSLKIKQQGLMIYKGKKVKEDLV